MSKILSRALISKINTLKFTTSISSRNSSSASILIDINDKTGFAKVSLNRMPVNSLNAGFLRELTKTLKDLEANKTRGVILTSTSPTIFSAGLDIAVLANGNEKDVRELWIEAQDSFLALYGSSYPIAAALTHTLAGGCFFALCAEYRAMVANHKIGLNEVLVGVAMPRIVIGVMREVLSLRESEKALLGGKIYTTEDALKIGLIDEIVADKNEAIIKCEKFLESFNAIPPQARANSKKIHRSNLLNYMKNERERDLKEFVDSVMNEETRAAVKKYLDALGKKKK